VTSRVLYRLPQAEVQTKRSNAPKSRHNSLSQGKKHSMQRKHAGMETTSRIQYRGRELSSGWGTWVEEKKISSQCRREQRGGVVNCTCGSKVVVGGVFPPDTLNWPVSACQPPTPGEVRPLRVQASEVPGGAPVWRVPGSSNMNQTPYH
jgi:hypothetical protein